MVGQITDAIYRRSYPTTVVIHIGSNDILQLTTLELRNQIPALLDSIRNLLPYSRIIWSDILPRREYYQEVKPWAGRKATNFANSQAHKAIYKLYNACFIKHSGVLSIDKSSLFRDDGTHLSKSGILVFKMSA